MATDLATAVQKAVYDALSAGVTLASVYQHVPQDTSPPYIVVEGGRVEYQGGKDSGLERHTVTIMTVAREPGRLPLLALQAEVRDTLHDQAITYPGAILSNPQILTAADQLLDDGITYVGSQNFLIFAQQSD